MSDYKSYVKDEQFLGSYNEYQQRYADTPSERDKATLRIVSDIAGEKTPSGIFSLLDIGCSTGNFLKCVQHVWPSLILTGGDLADSSLECARSNVPDVNFVLMDMLDIKGKYDVIVANAVCYMFNWSIFCEALDSVRDALSPGGTFIALDWYHPFDGQDLKIVETTESHPQGLTMYSRSYARAQWHAEDYFDFVRFQPFGLSIDLPEPPRDGVPISYTRKTEEGDRLCFRGSLYQPWCHMIAKKGK